MNPIYTSDKAALNLFHSAYPETNFRTVSLKKFSGPMSLNSYWDSGYRDYFKIIRVSDGKPISEIPQNGTPFDGQNLELSALPMGFALVVHHYQGVKQAGSIYFNEADLVPMLPTPTALSWAEKVVLCGTRSYKPAFRFDSTSRDCGITLAEWETAKTSLVEKGFLNKSGAITNEGKNLVGFTSPHTLARPVSASVS